MTNSMTSRDRAKRALRHVWVIPSITKYKEDIILVVEAEIETLAKEYDQLLASAFDECDQLRVQLAGCAVAAQGNISPDQIVVAGNYGWSPAYQDVLELRKRYEHLVELLKK